MAPLATCRAMATLWLPDSAGAAPSRPSAATPRAVPPAAAASGAKPTPPTAAKRDALIKGAFHQLGTVALRAYDATAATATAASETAEMLRERALDAAAAAPPAARAAAPAARAARGGDEQLSLIHI